MARTLIGELLLRIRADTKEAKSVSDALKNVERSAKSLGGIGWGSNFQQSLNKLKATPREMDAITRSWKNLIDQIERNGIDKAIARGLKSNWKSSVTSHFAAMRAEADRFEKHHDMVMRRIRDGVRVGLGAAGVYGTVQGVRAGARASGERQREYFRQEMAGLPDSDRKLMTDRAVELSGQYPSASATDIMEMARVAYTTMGNAERGNQILPGLVRGLVTLQSSKGVDAAPQMLNKLLNGIDNLGKNSMDDVGVKNTLDIIDGIIRSAQIENGEIDPGKLFDFARRSKIAGPGLSSNFIMTTAPAFMQDMTAEGFGTALSSAFQAFVIGANSNSSKVNIQAQRDLGLRVGNGNAGKGELIDSELFGHDPYAWVKKNLVPALAKGGVNIEDETAVAKAVAQLTKNTNASGLLTRMITQREQTDRKRQQYAGAMGTDAADQAAAKDPFVAWSGMTTSLENLSAAIGETVMPTIVPGLNSVSGAINAFGKALKDGNVLAWGGLAAGGVAAGAGALGVGAVITAWMTAGPALNGAAAALEAAAISLGSKGGAGDVASDTAKKAAAGGGLWALIKAGLKSAGVGGALTGATEMLSSSPGDTFDEQVRIQGERKEGLKRDLKRYFGWMAGDEGAQAANTKGIVAAHTGATVTAEVDSEQAIYQAQIAADDIKNALNITVGPNVDLTGLDALQSKLLACVASLGQLRAGIPATVADLNTQLNRSFADHQLTVVE